MRTRKLYHRDGERIELVTKLKGRMRVVVQLICLACILASSLMWQWTPDDYHWLKVASFAVVLLPFGWGEFGYLITPDGRIRFRARAFGVPLFGVTQHASKFSRGELIHDLDGDLALRFFDAKGEPVFTLDGIPDEELAMEILALVPYAENQQELAVNRAIDELIENNRERSPIFSTLCYLVLFPAAPLMVYLMGSDDIFWGAMIIGVASIAVVSHFLRRDEGIYRVSRDEGYADRWSRVGWFRVLDYRHYLGGDSEAELKNLRFTPASLVLPILVIAQAAAIWGGAILRESRDQRLEAEYRAREEEIFGKRDDPSAANVADNEEAVRKGAQILLEAKRRKEQLQREAAEKAAAEPEATEP